MTEEDDNEPFDDVTHWVGRLPKQDTVRRVEPDVQRKESPEKEGRQDKPDPTD